MLRALRVLRPKLIKATVSARPAATLPTRLFSAYTRTKTGQIPMAPTALEIR